MFIVFESQDISFLKVCSHNLESRDSVAMRMQSYMEPVFLRVDTQLLMYV